MCSFMGMSFGMFLGILPGGLWSLCIGIGFPLLQQFGQLFNLLDKGEHLSKATLERG